MANQNNKLLQLIPLAQAVPVIISVIALIQTLNQNRKIDEVDRRIGSLQRRHYSGENYNARPKRESFNGAGSSNVEFSHPDFVNHRQAVMSGEVQDRAKIWVTEYAQVPVRKHETRDERSYCTLRV